MQALTKLIDGDGYAHIYRGEDVIATFPNQDDADLFLQAESLITAADLSIRAGLDLLKERNSLAAEHGELRTVYLRACEELHAMKAALVDEGGGIPIGPAISLIEKLKADRDALAAHQVDLVRELTACQSVLFQLARAGEVTPEYADEAKAVLKCTPEISLGRHDARMAAEALEAAKTVCALLGAQHCADEIDRMARKMRREAEGRS